MTEVPDAVRPSPSSGETPARLTPTERRLLETLQNRPGQVLSRTELVTQVLEDSMASERTIDVHIRALRKKLGPAARIRTFRGKGYAWDAAIVREPPGMSR